MRAMMKKMESEMTDLKNRNFVSDFWRKEDAQPQAPRHNTQERIAVPEGVRN